MSLVTPLKRTAIIVRDMQRSLQFYRDLLGMNVWIQGQAGSEIPELFRLLGVGVGAMRWYILQSENIDWGMVGLFEIIDPMPEETHHPVSSQANRGEACLVFHTPEIDRIHQGALAMGLPVLCAPLTLVLAQHGVESREMTLRDPNGVLLNFIQNMKGGSVGLSNRFPGLQPS